MDRILKARWAIVPFWIALSIILTAFLPNMTELINERGTATIDSSYPSQVAKNLMNNLSSTNGKSGLFVFTDDSGLNDADRAAIQNGIEKLKADEGVLGVTSVTDSFDTPEAASSLVSSDGTTMLVQFTYQSNDRQAAEIQSELTAEMQDVPVNHYLTGDSFITSDYVSQTMKGVERSGILTVVFILLILVLMFRSAVTPLISLATIGISYLVSLGIVGQLVVWLDFPISTLTQMFMILILFGIGTDYNILLFNRFKEELGNQGDVDLAIKTTFKTAGKTVLYSGATVFIAFASLQFVEFSIYRSAVAIAISVVVLLAVLYTLMPALFKIFGTRLFWPSRQASEHRQSGLWARLSALAVKRPYLALVAIGLVLIPILTVGSYGVTFNTLDDMRNSTADSVVGFDRVADRFGDGAVMPTTVVISNASAMDDDADLSAIDQLTEKLRAIDGVASVSGPTQPQGKEISDLYVGGQSSQAATGLATANNGIATVSAGLGKMYDSISSPDFSQVSQLASGTATIADSMGKIDAALEQIRQGMDSGSSGAGQIADGIGTVKENLSIVSSTMSEQMVPGYTDLKSGMDTWAGGYRTMEGSLQTLISLAQSMKTTMAALPDHGDPAFIELYGDGTHPGMINTLIIGLQSLDAAMSSANSAYSGTISPNFSTLNSGLSQVSGGLPAMTDGLSQLETASDQLSQGLAAGSAGQAQVESSLKAMTAALGTISSGQSALASGLSTLNSSIGQLKDAIGSSRDGLGQISSGISSIVAYLNGLSSVGTFHIPDEALQSASFQKSLDAYMSSDRKTAKLVVTLDDEPYSDSAVATVQQIDSTLSSAMQGTSLSEATVVAGGQTSVTNDLKQVATKDMQTTQLIVLLSIFVVLILVTRSFWIPIYIIGSIMISYYASVCLASIFVQYVLGISELDWNVPFFGFLMIVTLGVDYSIFLMTRFREDKEAVPHRAIVDAAKNIGGVVLFAALILGGTFATMAPSGINTMIEIAVVVCIGIVLLSFIFLPFVLPACIAVQDWLTKRFSFSLRGKR